MHASRISKLHNGKIWKRGVESNSVVKLPDVLNGESGKGFTCTGLTYDAVENVYYMGNIGKITPDIPGCHSTIVKLSDDFTVNLGEIEIGKIFPTRQDVQGVTFDSSDNTLWFCSFGENLIRHITLGGQDLGAIETPQPTGIVYEKETDTLWVLTYTELYNIQKNGDRRRTIPLSLKGQDQIFLDEERRILYITAGNNYKGKNYVYTVDLPTGQVKKAYLLHDSCAVEGIFYKEGKLYIANDGYYHNAKVPENQINIYELEK